ncbi:hypothetical protein DHEL01_v204566 [Diaporthe helianthi]|uniref:HMG box domain-containing protein n=1 Tax=Diaporthe helianthi TaxID=158607 RepID=A0A2P5I3F9_DIAHE|nr:hypothetical protein DHEL01_v204566 [Diaporthe helianthi]
MDCENFKLSVRESATGISIDTGKVGKAEPQRHPALEPVLRLPTIPWPSLQPPRQEGSHAVGRSVPAPAIETNHVMPAAIRGGVLEGDGKNHKLVLEKPLSEFPSDGRDRIAESHAWVTRSVQKRLGELKSHAKVKGPANAFMRYRKAYAGVANELLPNVSQTAIATMIAQSWRMEPGSVRDQFHEMASMERAMHRQTFPAYTFSPKVLRTA